MLHMTEASQAAAKLARALLHVLHGLGVIALRFPWWTQERRNVRVQVWARAMLRILDIELVVQGRPPLAGPLLLLANHISWLDILVLHAVRHCRFVAKAEVRRWPLIGLLAAAAGTLYIERASRRDPMRVVRRMAASLREGDILAVFPEGTTSDGTTLLPFHANLVQAAISADAPVQPVALRFLDRASGEPSLAPSYIDQDTLLGSLWRTLSAPPLTAVVRFGTAQQAQGRDRRHWARELREAVAALHAAARLHAMPPAS